MVPKHVTKFYKEPILTWILLFQRCQEGRSYRPKEDRQNAKLSREFELDWMEREQAYNKAIEYIRKDPEHIFCKIVYKHWWYILPCGGYSLTIWKASDEIEFEEIPGSHVLFFSEMCFKWKDKVRLQGKEARPEDKKKVWQDCWTQLRQ